MEYPYTIRIIAAFIGVSFLAIGVNLAVHEWKRYHSDKRKAPRIIGAFIIMTLGLMLLAGVNFASFLTPTPGNFLRFWGAFFGLTLISLLLAGWDYMTLRREYKNQARRMIRKTLFGISDDDLPVSKRKISGKKKGKRNGKYKSENG
ncbi:MAG: hypothetical protein B6244_11230 [Candidatus Cloacimonetes bacterium 4572_55]|nr:MAG: hypothetical protein B6244_11230 [Candidatus Cloacimonetes bacterium 4572_55]